MYKKWDAVDLLRHVRHDWLNQLQLIKGNLMLNKPARAEKVIDEIIVRAKQDAKLTSLNMPDLAGILLTFNWGSHRFLLDYEVVGEERDLSTFEETILNWFVMLIDILDRETDEFGENHLLVTFLLVDEKTRITIDFNGKIKNIEEIKRLESKALPSFSVIESEIEHDQLLITLELNENGV